MEGSSDSLAKVRTVDGAELDVPVSALKVSGYFRDFLEDHDTINEVLDISEF